MAQCRICPWDLTMLVMYLVSLQPLIKELDEMEKINAKLSAAVEEVTLEHCKKIEVIYSSISRKKFISVTISF